MITDRLRLVVVLGSLFSVFAVAGCTSDSEGVNDGGKDTVGADDARAPDGVLPDSAAPDSAVPDSAAPDGAVADGAAPDSVVADSLAVGDGAASVTIHGTLKGSSPAGARILVLWTVSAGSPDYSYKAGELQVTGGTFSGTLAAPPPAALNNGVLGVANLILVPDSFSLPDGKVADFNAIKTALIGGAETHAVIYLASPMSMPWADRFGTGFSCGELAPPLPGKSFDTFEPTDCGALEVTVATKPDWPNWT